MEKEHRARLARLVLVAVVGVALISALGWAMRPVDEDKINNNGNGSGNGQQDGADTDEFYWMERLSSGEILDRLDEGWTGFIYTGRDTCPACQQFTPLFLSAVRSLEMEGEIVYFDTDATMGEVERQAALDVLGIRAVPTVQYIKNGEIAGEMREWSSTAAIRDFLIHWKE